MKSTRLDQLDSYQTTFQSHVIATHDNWVALAESLFYPTSGGQLFDTGTLNEIAILDVEKRSDLVWHKLEHPSLAEGDSVEGSINWARRYKHMQRHTGQHLLSQAFIRINPVFETRSVSLTGETCTIDFAGEPSASSIRAAEVLVNEMLYKNLGISAFEIDDSELGNYPLRRPPKVSGRIRLVQMGDWELSACGGTHLRTSAEAAPIKLLRSERIKSGLTRVHFKVGLEALADYHLKHTVSYDLAQSFSAQVQQLPQRVEGLKTELQAVKQNLIGAQKQLAKFQADSLLTKAENTAKGKLVIHVLQEQALLSPLAEALLTHNNVIALLAVKLPDRVNLLFTRSDMLDVDMNALLKHVLPILEGRGGGKADRAQGSGSKPDALMQAFEAARKLLH